MTFESIPFVETIFLPSCRAAGVILGLFLLRYCLGKYLSPAMRHAFWGLVPIALLPMLAISSPVSVYHLLPQNESRERNVVERPDQPASEPVIALPFVSGFHESPAENAASYPESGDFAALHPRLFEVRETSVSNESRERNEVERPDQPASEPVTALPFVSGFHWIFAILYLAGCLAMTLVFLRQALACRRWIKLATPVKNERILALFQTCQQRINIKTWLVVVESPAVSGPFLIGAVRPVLLLPSGMVESATAAQLQTVFLHELAHLKRWDVWTGWAATLILILHWFNPMLWLAIRRMNADREEACDALAVKTLNDSERGEYALSLMDIAERFVVPKSTRGSFQTLAGLVGISESGNFLTRRINMINQNRTWKLRWKILALLAVLLLGVTTLTDAQERKRSVAEIQADIDKLQIELREAREEAHEEKIVTAYRLLSLDADMVTTAVATLFPYPESNVPWSLTREMLVVVGSEADHALVREMFEEISKMQKQIEMNPRPPREIGSIIVGGKEIDFAATEKAALMRSVEEATAKKRETIQTIPLEHRRVDGELARTIGEFVRGRSIGFSFSPSTNSVHLQGFPSDVAEVEALILELDKPTVEEPHLAGVPAGSLIGGHAQNYHLSLPNVESFDAFPVFLENEPNVKIDRSDKQSNAYLVSGAVEDIQETMDRFYQLSMEEIATLAYGEMSFESYSLTGISVNAGIDATVVIRLFGVLAPSIKVVHDRGTNSFFVLGRKTEHERVKEALVQLREAFTTENWDALPADKKVVRVYTVPIGVDQSVVTFFATTLAPDVMIVPGSTPRGLNQFAIYGLKSDHAKVQAMFDKMQSAREAAREDSSSPLQPLSKEGEEAPRTQMIMQGVIK